MKRQLIILLFVLVCSVVAGAQQRSFVPSCLGSNDTAKFTEIIAKIGSNQGVIRLTYDGSRCAVNNLTIPLNVTLDNTDGDGIKINAGQTLTDVGPIVNPVGKQLFHNALSGQGAVSFAGNRSLGQILPQWWGAVGDGKTNCTSAIQAAINSASSAGAGTLFFPAGTYNHTGLTLKSGVNLVGIGKNRLGVVGLGSTLHNTNSSGGHALTIAFDNAVHGSLIEDLAIEGNGSSGHGLYMLGRSAADGGEVNAASELHVRNCMFNLNGKSGVYIYYAWPVIFEGCLFLQNSKYGVQLDKNANAISFIGCHFQGNILEGIYGSHTAGLTINGGAIEGNNQSSSAKNYDLHLDNAHGVAINGVYFEATTAGRCIDLGASTKGILISGNVFYINKEILGIYANGIRGFEVSAVIQGNEFIGIDGGTGIHLGADVRDSIASPNSYSGKLDNNIIDKSKQ